LPPYPLVLLLNEFVVVVFVIDRVRKLLDTPSYIRMHYKRNENIEKGLKTERTYLLTYLLTHSIMQNIIWKPEYRRPLGRPRRRWEDNIKLDLREIGIDV
jgi:hypothetical protein